MLWHHYLSHLCCTQCSIIALRSILPSLATCRQQKKECPEHLEIFYAFPLFSDNLKYFMFFLLFSSCLFILTLSMIFYFPCRHVSQLCLWYFISIAQSLPRFMWFVTVDLDLGISLPCRDNNTYSRKHAHPCILKQHELHMGHALVTHGTTQKLFTTQTP